MEIEKFLRIKTLRQTVILKTNFNYAKTSEVHATIDISHTMQ